MKKILLTSALLGSVLSTNVLAQDYPDFEVYLGAARYFWDSERNLDDSNSLEGGIEIPMSEVLSLEAWLSDFDADTNPGSVELEGRRYSLGGLYHLSDGDLRPFVSLGASHQEFEPPASSDFDESLLYLGLGAKKYFDNNFILRGELLAMNSVDYEVTDLAARVAVGYAFGKTSKPVPMEPEKVVKVEPVAEPVKKMEPKPEPKPVEPAPQPEPVKVVPVPVEPVKVDSDGDGVYDDADACPETDKAFKVDQNGCPIKLVETVSINLEVKFKSNSAEVSGSEQEIKELADFLNRFKDTNVTVEGYTDDRGRAAYNKQLSQKRADAVRMKLISDYGINSGRVNAIGYGEESPIASNDTAEGRASNRRVVGRVSANQERMQTK